jgi:hypothetical protein
MNAPRYVLVEVIGAPDDETSAPVHETIKAHLVLSTRAFGMADRITFRSAPLNDAVLAATVDDDDVEATMHLREAVEALR